MSGISSSMKGLSQFIIEFRNSKDAEEEQKRINLELNNISTKFSSSLIESSNYMENQLGYLGISILQDFNSAQSTKEYLSDKLDLVGSFLVKDLQSNNENKNSLAIQFIASNFNINDIEKCEVLESDDNSSQWLELIDIVCSFCISPVQKTLLKKKASLALFSLLKLYPQVILSNDNWVPRLLTLMDDDDLGVVTASVPLIEFVIGLRPQYIKTVIQSAANKLYFLVIENQCPSEYYYYELPAPWLIIKLLSLIECCFLFLSKEGSLPIISSLDQKSLNNLRQVTAISIRNASKPISGSINKTSQSAILFQAVSLLPFLDASPEAIEGAIYALVSLLSSNETNTRYLSLDALIKLTARLDSNYNRITRKFDENLITVYQLLNDKDISVRRKSLDLIYTICSSENYGMIIAKLLDYFRHADVSLKPQLAIKIAVLAERFATDSTWYVTNMLHLLSFGSGANSNYIGNEIWERIVQIIVNNEDLQEKSSRLIFDLLRGLSDKSFVLKAGVSESLIKVAAFVFGEFGHLINDDSIKTVSEQVQLLYTSYFQVSLVTRAILLSALLKITIRYPSEDFIPDIIDLFEVETQSIDLEIQTRACEYLKLATLYSSSNITKGILKPLPFFQKRESPLMERIGSVNQLINRNRSNSSVNVSKIKNHTYGNYSHEHSSIALPISEEDLNENEFENSINTDPFDEQHTNKSQTILAPNWYSGYHRMLHYDAGIFFENQLVKITYRTERKDYNTILKFTIINSSSKTTGNNITSLKVLNLESLTKSTDPNYLINITQFPDAKVIDKTSMEISIKIRNEVDNDEGSILTLSFVCGGSFNQLNLKFPVVLLKTLTATALTMEDFKRRWLQIGELLSAEEGENTSEVSTSHRYNAPNVVRLLSRLGFSVVHSSNENDSGILVACAGILHTQKSKYGLLVTISSPNSLGKDFNIVVRCTGGGIPSIIGSTLNEIFSGKF